MMKLQGIEFDTQGLKLPVDIVSNMFAKAERLVCGTNSIVPAPGTATAKLVESKSGHRPHFVTRKGLNKYRCDSDCAMWKCFKICSHTIAAAFTDKNLQQFLSVSGAQPNLYELAKSNTKENAGKKPARRKASTKAATKAIAQIQQELSGIPTPQLNKTNLTIQATSTSETSVVSGMGRTGTSAISPVHAQTDRPPSITRTPLPGHTSLDENVNVKSHVIRVRLLV